MYYIDMWACNIETHMRCFAGLHSLAKERTSRQTMDSEQSETSSTTVIKARTNVSAFQAPKEAVAAVMCQHPELADALQSKVIQHMADQTVAEAIGALHGANERNMIGLGNDGVQHIS